VKAGDKKLCMLLLCTAVATMQRTRESYIYSVGKSKISAYVCYRNPAALGARHKQLPAKHKVVSSPDEFKPRSAARI